MRHFVLGEVLVTLELMLRLSVIQAELLRVAETLAPSQARVVRYAARVLGLLKR